MNREKIILWIWGCWVVVFVAYYFCQMLLNTILKYKTSKGSEIEIDGGGLIELALILAVYFITKHLIRTDEAKK